MQRLTQQLAGGLEFAAAAAASGFADFLSRVQQQPRRLGSGLNHTSGMISPGPDPVGALGHCLGRSTNSSSTSRSIAWRRNWQRFWSSDIRVEVGGPPNLREGTSLDSLSGRPSNSTGIPTVGTNSAAGSSEDCMGRSSSASTGSCGSCSPASSPSGSGCSDGISITLDMGDIRPGGAGGGDFCYNEESFQARLRAKQLGTAEAAFPARW